MSNEPTVIRSMFYWVEPPEIGQPLEELDWVWIDILSNGKMVVRDQKPTDKEVSDALAELAPLFDWDQ